MSMPCITEYERAFDALQRSPDTPRSIVIGAILEEPMMEIGYQMVGWGGGGGGGGGVPKRPECRATSWPELSTAKGHGRTSW